MEGEKGRDESMNKDMLKIYLNLAAVAGLFYILYLFKMHGNEYQIRILNNMAIFIILAVSYNLVNGFCGVLHLGPTPLSPSGPTPPPCSPCPPRKSSSTSSFSR